MFDALSEKISGIFRAMGGNIRLTESNIQEGLREIRLALLEADVSLPVVKDFIARVTDKALGQEVLRDVTPGQFLVKVVHDELVELLGGATSELNLTGPEPQVIMLVGLQGSGKTTSTAKLAHLLRERKMRPYLVPADVYRPAAIDQLTTLAGQLDMPVYPSSTGMNPVDIARNAVTRPGPPKALWSWWTPPAACMWTNRSWTSSRPSKRRCGLRKFCSWPTP